MNNFHAYFSMPQDEKPSDDRKIFVGGLSWETRDAQLKEYFEKFGEVETVNLKLNPQTGRYVFLGFLKYKTLENQLHIKLQVNLCQKLSFMLSAEFVFFL